MGAFLVWSPKVGPSKSLYFDLCSEEEQTFTSTATEHPVEVGANVSDHVREELDRVSLEVFVSNTPVYDVNSRGAAVKKLALDVPKYKAPLAATPGAVFSAIGSAVRQGVGQLLGATKEPAGANVMQFDTEFDAVADTLALLEKLKREVQLVDVYLPSRVHESTMLESISVRRDAGTGDAAKFALGFKQIRKVEARIVTAPVPTEIRGQIAKPKGAQAPKPAKAPEQKRAAVLYRIRELARASRAASGL